MRIGVILFLLVSHSCLAQLTVYQAFEVDSAAEPRGGVVFFNTFMQSTLRKPIPAQAVGIGGRVIVEGVVEPNGHISNVNILQKIRPDCDREAARVFSLFNAWKPGLKNGQAVRQRVTMPIAFQPNTPFTYANGARITYFGSDSKAITDSSLAQYKQIAPIDTSGVPTGDIIVYESKSKGWKEYVKMPLVHRKNTSSGSTKKITYTAGNQNYKKEWEGNIYLLDNNGIIIHQAFYSDGKRNGSELSYHSNGAIAEKKDESDEKTAIMSWYANGQIKQIKVNSKAKLLSQSIPELVTAYWDSTGHQEVTNGNGQAIYQNQVRSGADTTQYTLFVEQGDYRDGLKQGVWKGRYTNGSFFYEEQYDKGICQAGKARSAGSDTVRYSVIEQQPEFIGGMQALGQFLAQNLRYPVDAQRARVQGRVFVSFVINTDGRVDDVQVLKGVGFGADEEATRVVKATNGHWKPGFQRGQRVKVKYNLPINFTLN